MEGTLNPVRLRGFLIFVLAMLPGICIPVLSYGAEVVVSRHQDETAQIRLRKTVKVREYQIYRVKRGEHLFEILRQQLGLREMKEILKAFNQVKELNPRKKNWNLLSVGEDVLLPPLRKGEPAAMTSKPAREFIGLDYGIRLPVTENLHLLQQVVGVTGNEFLREGEETFAFKEGTIHIDRSLIPVIRNSQSGKKVVLDVEGEIAASSRTKSQSQIPEISIVPIKRESSLHEAANSLFSHLGFQTLQSNRPVVVQDGGVALQVKGEWMVTNAREDGGRQEIWIISLSDVTGKIPDYLKEYLSLRGMNLEEILLPTSSLSPVSRSVVSAGHEGKTKIQSWPRDKRALVDAFLKIYQIPFSTDREISIPLRQGIRLDTKIDRLFKHGGKEYGVFFRFIGDEVRRALEKGRGIKPIELDFEFLSSREMISRLLHGLGERAAYQEHRFPVVRSGAKDKLVLAVSGFFLPNRS
ncbi:MAG: hypothetical protein ACE5JU_15835, partial [Candidatus Binatia bacterium]